MERWIVSEYFKKDGSFYWFKNRTTTNSRKLLNMGGKSRFIPFVRLCKNFTINNFSENIVDDLHKMSWNNFYPVSNGAKPDALRCDIDLFSLQSVTFSRDGTAVTIVIATESNDLLIPDYRQVRTFGSPSKLTGPTINTEWYPFVTFFRRQYESDRAVRPMVSKNDLHIQKIHQLLLLLFQSYAIYVFHVVSGYPYIFSCFVYER